MSRRRKTPWTAIVVIGGLASVIGVVALVKRAESKELPPNPLLVPITDPIVVREWQTKVVGSIKNGSLAMAGLGEGDYNANDVDGNPSNPRWMRALAALQALGNKYLAQATASDLADLPQGYPTQLRTDGVLDRATVIAMEHF